MSKIPIIDIFAGPGGLGEGFSSLMKGKRRVFDIKLSIEKDPNAQETLELRSFYRKFTKDNLPEEYYELLRSNSIKERLRIKAELYLKYPKQYKEAKKEAWLAELGSQEFPSVKIDNRIQKELKGRKDWVLIGGPPCQAYSLVGRSRVGGIDEEDERVYLYQQYLRIIAKHSPSVFIMENVKGLLSAKLGEVKVFDKILEDLKKPAVHFDYEDSFQYKIYSLSTELTSKDLFENPIYKDGRDFLIKSENYGVPQKRHRIILMGVREDIDVVPDILTKQDEVSLKSVIEDLPKIRSGLHRSYNSKKILKAEKSNRYSKVEDSFENWKKLTSSFRHNYKEKGFYTSLREQTLDEIESNGKGGEFIKFNTPNKCNPLYQWYNDEKLNGVINHESRSHLTEDIYRYQFATLFSNREKRFPRMNDYAEYAQDLLPRHKNATSGKFADRFRVQLADEPATTVTSHISKDGHYFIHYDVDQCRSLSVREAARIQTFPDNYLFCGPRTAQYHQVGNAVPPFLAFKISKIVYDLIEESRNSRD